MSEDDEKEKKYKFQKLAPISSEEECDIEAYEDILDFIFEKGNEDLRNIAITGTYGSGKSSVIKTYERKRNKKKKTNFVYVSLAQFDVNDEEKRSKDNDEEKRSEDYDEEKRSEDNDEEKRSAEIERKLINQLIHQIEPNKISQAHFKIHENVPKVKMCANALVVTLFISFILYILNYNKIVEMIKTSKLLEGSTLLENDSYLICTERAFITSIIVSIIIVNLFIFKLIKAQKENNILRRISVGNGEIEMSDNKPEDYFDKYLNEVIYIFKNSSIDVVVYEDIDRFDNKKIFNRLMEINKLINVRIDIPIRFFYLVREELFSVDDKTKFFDYVIPIVPVVHSSNSYAKFKEILEEDEVDEILLRNVSMYINNMRIIKNICNEYIIYKKKLFKIGEGYPDLDERKMFAMIVYKNMFPDDFEKLQNRDGILFEIIEKQDKNVYKPEKYIVLDIMINHGYIVGDYYQYIAPFYTGSLSHRDEHFLKKIRSGNTSEEEKVSMWTYIPDSPKKILSMLSDDEFIRYKILNVSLLDELYDMYELEEYRMVYVIIGIVKLILQEKNLNFISYFVKYGNNIYNFMDDIDRHDNEIHKTMIKNKSIFTQDEVKKYIIHYFFYCNIELGIANIVEEYINDNGMGEYIEIIKMCSKEISFLESGVTSEDKSNATSLLEYNCTPIEVKIYIMKKLNTKEMMKRLIEIECKQIEESLKKEKGIFSDNFDEIKEAKLQNRILMIYILLKEVDNKHNIDIIISDYRRNILFGDVVVKEFESKKKKIENIEQLLNEKFTLKSTRKKTNEIKKIIYMISEKIRKDREIGKEIEKLVREKIKERKNINKKEEWELVENFKKQTTQKVDDKIIHKEVAEIIENHLKYQIIKNNINEVIKSKEEINYDLLKKLLEDEEIEIVNRRKLLKSKEDTIDVEKAHYFKEMLNKPTIKK